MNPCPFGISVGMQASSRSFCLKATVEIESEYRLPRTSPTPFIVRTPRVRLNRGPHLFESQAEIHQHLGCVPLFFAQQSQQDMLSADVAVEMPSFLHRESNDLLRSRRYWTFAEKVRSSPSLFALFDRSGDCVQLYAKLLQHGGCHTTRFFYESTENVFSADEVVI